MESIRGFLRAALSRSAEDGPPPAERHVVLVLLALTLVTSVVWAVVADRVPDEGVYFGEIMELVGTGSVTPQSTHPAVVFTWLGAGFVMVLGVFGIDPLLAVRLLGALCVVACGYLAYRTVKLAAPAWPEARLAAIPLVTMTPMFTYMGASANSDTLLNVWCALLFFGLVHALRRGLSAKVVAVLAVAVLLGALTKERVWVVVAVLPFAAAVGFASVWYRRRLLERDSSQDLEDADALSRALVAITVVGLSIFLWRQFGSLLTERPVPFAPWVFGELAPAGQVWEWFGDRGLSWLAPTFWARFGYLDVYPPEWVQTVWNTLLAVGAWSLILYAGTAIVLHYWHGRALELITRPGSQAMIVAAAAVALALYSVAQYEIVLALSSQGRYLFIVSVPIALLMLRGMFGVVTQHLHRPLGILIAATMFGVNWYCLFYVAIPAFRPF